MTTAEIEEVLERARHDPAFAAALHADPAKALHGYTLSAQDLRRLGDVLTIPRVQGLRFGDLFEDRDLPDGPHASLPTAPFKPVELPAHPAPGRAPEAADDQPAAGPHTPAAAKPAVEPRAREVEPGEQPPVDPATRESRQADVRAARRLAASSAGTGRAPSRSPLRRRQRQDSGGIPGPDGVLSRRRLFGLLGGAAAAGAGIAVVGSTLGADPAGATAVTPGNGDGDALQIGGLNKNSNPGATTTLSGSTSGAGPMFDVQMTSGSAAGTSAISATFNGGAAGSAAVNAQLGGSSAGSSAVRGLANGSGGPQNGVLGQCSNAMGGVGVVGAATTTGAIGLKADSPQGAALLLVDEAQTMPPTVGTWTAGSMVFSGGKLWLCTSGGMQGTWVDLSSGSRLVPLPSPARIYDSRPGQLPSTGPKSPITGGGTVALDVTNNLSGVPATARAVLGNLTVTDTTGPGFLTVYAHGTSKPATSSINWIAGWTIANNFTSAVSMDPVMPPRIDVTCGGTATDFIVDILGYYP